MQKTQTAKSLYETPALDKGLDIIELLAAQATGLTKSEIARRLDRSVSEIFRMLVTLERRRYIAQMDGERYNLTLHLFRLVQEHPPIERLLTEALPAMHRLSRLTNQSCHMGVLEGIQVVILAQVNAPGSTGFYVRLGSVVDLMESSTGQVILANQPDLHRQRVLREWRQATRKRVPGNLSNRLIKIRNCGGETHDSFQIEGVVNMSCPVIGEDGSAIGALTIPYIKRLHDPVSRVSTFKALRLAAAEISLAVGGTLAAQAN